MSSAQPPAGGPRAPRQGSGPTARVSSSPTVRRRSERAVRDDQHNQYFLLGIAGLAAVIVAALAIGWVWDNVIQAQATAAEVYGDRITARQVANEAKTDAQIYDSQARSSSGGSLSSAAMQQLDQQKRALPDQALNTLVQQKIIQHEADRRGISVSDDEVSQKMQEQVAQYAAASATDEPTVAPDASPSDTASPSATTAASPTPVPTLEPAAYQDTLQKLLQPYGVSQQQYRDEVASSLLQQKVQDAIGAEVPTTQEQVHALQITTSDDATASAALDRLNNGEDFGQVAQDASTDTATKAKGGDLGWLPRGIQSSTWDDAAFALQAGQTSGVVKTGAGDVIIRVVERDPNRPVAADVLQKLKSKAYSAWLSGQQSSPDVKLEMTQDEKDWALRQIGVRP